MAILAECPICKNKQSIKNKKCKCGEDLDKAKRAQRIRFWIQFRLPDGRQRKEFVGTSIEEARDAYGARRIQKREGRWWDMLPASKMTFKELSDWYLELESVKALASYKNGPKLRINQFNEVYGDMVINDIKPIDIENYITRLKSAKKSNGEIDQRIGKVKAMINKAFENRLISVEPYRVFKLVKNTVKRGTDVRNRILIPDEFKALMAHASDHLKPILATGYYTGMRKGEILNLTWDKIDLVNHMIRLNPEDTKDKEARNIPICDELYTVFLGLPNRIHKADSNRVFQYLNEGINDNFKKSLKSACKNAKIIYGRKVKGGFIFHDLRHTFNTNMRKAGVPESVIMEITGHSTREMFDRYNTIDEEDTRKAIDQFQAYFANVTQSVTQNDKIDKDTLKNGQEKAVK